MFRDGQGKVHPRTGYESPEGEQTDRSTSSLTSALDEVGGQRQASAALPRKRDSTYCIGGWVSPRAGVECSVLGIPKIYLVCYSRSAFQQLQHVANVEAFKWLLKSAVGSG